MEHADDEDDVLGQDEDEVAGGGEERVLHVRVLNSGLGVVDVDVNLLLIIKIKSYS